MTPRLDALISEFENGVITRRELLGALTALVASQRAATAAEPLVAPVRQLNHVSIFVENVQRSVAFYQNLFGMPVLTLQDPGVNLAAGASFVGVYPGQGRPGINHLCLGLDNFDADATLKKLTSQGVAASIRLRGDTKELYFTDPDNIRVQLQDVRYRGGVGPLGDRDPAR